MQDLTHARIVRCYQLLFRTFESLPEADKALLALLQSNLQMLRIMRSPKRKFQILNGISGVLKPVRFLLSMPGITQHASFESKLPTHPNQPLGLSKV